MNPDQLGALVLKQRGNQGVRAAAAEIGISPTTLTRIEKGGLPDNAVLQKVCAWLGEEPARFNGIGNLQIAFKNKGAVPPKTARSLAKLIERAAEAFSHEVDARGH